jgi:4a-hydroxytetrahydrobiopterin dehydratase
MSEQGRHAFLAAEGLDDWVVLHGGPTAVFSASSLTQAAELAAEIAKTVKLDDTPAQLNVVSNRLTVRLTREVWNIETEHIEIARAISKIASSFGAVAEPHRVQEVQVAIAAKSDAINLKFWRAVLGYDPMLDDNGVDPLGNSSTVWMQELDDAKDLKHGMHFDVSVARDQAEERLAAAVAAGGVVVDDSHAPAWWVLADSSGNKVCIVSWPDGAIDPQDTSEK